MPVAEPHPPAHPAGPAPHAGQVDVIRGLTELVAQANAGNGGLVGLQFATELAAAACAADGATFIEYGEGGGRVVAAWGDAEFLLGRPIDVRIPAIAAIVAGPPMHEMNVSGFDPTGELPDSGLNRVLRAAAIVGGATVGALQVYFRRAEGRVPEPNRSWLGLIAECVAHQYVDGNGVPVYERGGGLGPASIALAVVDPKGRVRSWNPAAARLTGLKSADTVGKPFPFPLPGPSETVEHAVAGGAWIRIRATRLPGVDAVALSMRAHSEPTDREQSRDLFLAVASHELRTPVTVIRGYADTLVEHWEALDEPARREAVLVLGQRARELGRLVDRLLTAASDAAGLLDGVTGTLLDVADVVREATDDLPHEIRAEVRLDLPQGLPRVVADRVGLATVVTELVTNACKYSPARVHVDVTAGASAQTVWFRVSDRGVGIRPEHVERAFERFWQLDSGDQRRYGGVGLGLYLVRRIVERQRGWVSLRPREGGGTVAEVRLPRAGVDTWEDPGVSRTGDLAPWEV
jgi:two-component system, OmpR family, phosphate regulon sensor histidine kinase PhoR